MRMVNGQGRLPQYLLAGAGWGFRDRESGVATKLFASGIGLLKDGAFVLAKIELSASDTGLPDPVVKTFTATFPKAEIDKWSKGKEGDTVVYVFRLNETIQNLLYG